MRNRCLPKLGSIYIWKSKKGEIATVKAKGTSKLTVEECWIREDVKDKSQIHDSRDTKKNSSLRENKVIITEGKGVADDKFEDTLALDESLDIEIRG